MSKLLPTLILAGAALAALNVQAASHAGAAPMKASEPAMKASGAATKASAPAKKKAMKKEAEKK